MFFLPFLPELHDSFTAFLLRIRTEKKNYLKKMSLFAIFCNKKFKKELDTSTHRLKTS